MRSSQLLALSTVLVPAASAAMISFAMDSDTCGDGFYIGCFGLSAGQCCDLRSGYQGRSVNFVLDETSAVVGKAYSGAGCAATDLVGEQASPSDVNFFCLTQPSALVSSAHFEAAGVAARKTKKSRGTKECRSPDHVVFPGGARASIEDLAEREYLEMNTDVCMLYLDMIVARSDAAAVEAKIAAFRK
ncbi:hypothetical protein Micbo1qcDRAFT_179162 [Microdochium bolleyi]|uniref:Uncharacterized protein n=1 Tax=Microdochium bolleyi TaxID=196109 RepID=A0A136IQT1_9PEZI|nr:hypothetical protein Micbo1qcDRAFT_179162 [Microdochium bolleyi]